MSILSKIKKTIKYGWLTVAVGSVGVVGYNMYIRLYDPTSQMYNYDDVSHFKSKIDALTQELDKVKGDDNQYNKYVIKATTEYSWNDIISLAHNGLYECPSSEFHSSEHRCDVMEEASVMIAAVNLFKAEPYKTTLGENIYHRLKNGNYLFSWVPKIKEKDTSSRNFDHSMFVAMNVLGGNPEYLKYDVGQTHYCNDSVKTADCSWHKDNLIELGKMDYRTRFSKLFIASGETSKHIFYKIKGE